MQQRNPEARTGSFGDLLRQYRIDSGLTQEELAERAGLSVRGISDLERGVRQEPYRHTVRRLAEVLQLGESERAALDAARHPPSPAVQQQSPPTLPVLLTSFIGRERELEELRRLLSTRRLLSVVGTGGVGKTRLAVEVARMPRAESPAFVDLAPLSDARLVPAAVAAVLGVRDQPTVPPLDALTAAIAARSLLLILDNCEHLVQACAELVDHLLRGCPGLRILVTSREPLGVEGEQRWHVLPLAVPGPSDSDAAGASEAVQLFVERARLVQPTFELDDENVVTVTDICRRLDGIPLAIELAAAQMTVLAPHQLAERLEDRFRLLALGSRTASARQQTLHAVIDWSHHLLTDAEQSLFRRLGVFAGGWTLEMAEQTCAGNELAREQIFDLLARLVEKSMVQVSQKGVEARYSFLETLRQYAAERLTSAAEDERVRGAHLQWCVGLAERADAEKDGPQRAAWLTVLEREHGNLRAALDWSLVDPPDPEAALRLSGALGWFWWLRGHVREGGRRMSEVLDRTSSAPMNAASSHPVARARAWALAEAGRLHMRQHDLTTARRLLEESLSLAQHTSHREAEACALLYLGELALEHGDSASARSHLDRGLVLARTQPWHGPHPGRFLHWLGHAAEYDAQPTEATSLYLQARELATASNDALFEAIAVRGLASAAIDRGDLVGAQALLLETVALPRGVENATIDYGTILTYFARLAVAEGQLERALRLAGAAAGLRTASGTELFRHDRELLERRLDQARRSLTGPAAAAADAEGLAMHREAALEYAVQPSSSTLEYRSQPGCSSSVSR